MCNRDDARISETRPRFLNQGWRSARHDELMLRLCVSDDPRDAAGKQARPLRFCTPPVKLEDAVFSGTVDL